MKPKLGSVGKSQVEPKPVSLKKKLVVKMDQEQIQQAPGLKKASDEERNKQIPNYVMDAIRTAFQKKLSTYFDPSTVQVPKMEESQLSGQPATEQKQLPPLPPVEEEERTDVADEAETRSTIEKIMGTTAVNISKEVHANCIVTIEKGDSESIADLNLEDVKVVIFKHLKKGTYQRVSYNTKMKRIMTGSVLPVKELLMEAVNRKYIGKGDKIIFIGGESIGSWLKGFFFIFDVDKVFFDISTHHLTEKIDADVIEAIINIAQEIGNEGREGRSIGTAFVVGQKDQILKLHKPLLKINPFASLPEESRKITDPEMKETVKNLAQLDGVFLIDEKGVILTAGAFINIDQANLDLQGLQGFGTRHRCTAAITKLTDAIGVVVSASGGTIRIFKDGKAIMKLP